MRLSRLHRLATGIVAMVLSLLNCPIQAEESKAPSADEAAIRQAAKNYVDALNRGDVKALLSAWTPDGDYINPAGEKFLAHDLIQREFSKPTAEKEQQRVVEMETALRFVTADVAIEDGTNEIDSPGVGGVTAGNFTAVWVKRGGKWLLASIREYVPATAPQHQPLDDLAWMIGHWVGEANDTKYEFTTRWSDDGHFLLRDFTVERAGQVVMQGNQRIGWDAANKTVRSWAFDSQGGYGEGVWGSEGNTWFVENKGALADGRHIESINVYTLNDDGSVDWRVESSKVDDEALPELTVKYVKE